VKGKVVFLFLLFSFVFGGEPLELKHVIEKDRRCGVYPQKDVSTFRFVVEKNTKVYGLYFYLDVAQGTTWGDYYPRDMWTDLSIWVYKNGKLIGAWGKPVGWMSPQTTDVYYLNFAPNYIELKKGDVVEIKADCTSNYPTYWSWGLGVYTGKR